MSPPRPAGPLTIWDVALTAFGAAVIVLAGITVLPLVLGSGREARAALDLTFVVLALEAVALAASVYVFAIFRRRRRWADIGLRPLSRRAVGRALLAGLLCYAGVTGLLAGLDALLDRPLVNPQVPILLAEGVSWRRLAGLLALGGLLVPFTEELFFRGILYGWLRRRWGVRTGILVSAVLFAIAHAFFLMVALGALLVGVILALVYERTGSLWAPAVVHAVFNSLSLITMFAAQAVAGGG